MGFGIKPKESKDNQKDTDDKKVTSYFECLVECEGLDCKKKCKVYFD